MDSEKIECNLLSGETFVKNSILYHKDVFDEAIIDLDEPIYMCVSGVQELIKKVKIFSDSSIPITIHTTKFTDKNWLNSDITTPDFAGKSFDSLELGTKIEFNDKRLKLNFNFHDVFIFKQNFRWINEKRKKSLRDESDEIAIGRFKMTKDDITKLISLVDMDSSKDKDKKTISISFKQDKAIIGCDGLFEYQFDYESTGLIKEDKDILINYNMFQKLDVESYDVLFRYIFPPSDTSADGTLLSFFSEESNTIALITRSLKVDHGKI